MKNVYASSLLMGMCLMGCFGDEGGAPTDKASGPVDDDPAVFVVQATDRELAQSELAAARHGLNDAVKSARVANIDVAGMTERLSAGSKLKLALPGAGHAVLVIQSVRELLPGITTFSGHLADDENADFTLSIEAGKLVGSIRKGTHAWLVEPHTGSDQHLIRAIDRTMLPKDEPTLAHPQQLALSAAPKSIESPQPTSMLLNTGIVRVLFLHAANVANVSAQAANIVTAFNNSLSLSEVSANNYIETAGVQQVESTFDGQSRNTIITAMENRAAPFTGIDAAMASASADVAFLLVQEDPTAVDVFGFGRVGGAAFQLQSNKPFALSTDDYALGDFTALHELGHVFGGHHEDIVQEIAGIARPVVELDCAWMTVMGGYVQCGGLTSTVVRLNRWSNPDQTYGLNGPPLGIAGQRDMESHLESAMPLVSAWRGDPWTPPPSAAFSINGQTNGSITLTANTPFTLSYSSTNAVSCDLTAYSNGSLWYSNPNYHSSYNWGTLTGLGTGSYSWHIVCRNASGETASASASLTMVCDSRAGTHGQTWTAGGGYSQYAYNGGWCSIGTQLPPMCFQGTYYYYQYQLSSYCASAGSGGSCYSSDAWWWVTCQSLVDCVFNCSGECVQSSC